MAEGTVLANGITLWYETFGEPTDPALVLIAGLGYQTMGSWLTPFCERLAAGRRYVLRFDNRDTGLSQWFDESATYTLADMADDVVGLLDALGIAHAHVLGRALGGAIAQWVAVRHPERVLSLTSLMTGPYTPAEEAAAGLTPPPAVLPALLAAPVRETREGRIAWSVDLIRAIWGDLPFDEAERWEVEAQLHDRAWRPAASALHAAARQRSPSRVDALRRLTVPTLVIHGTADGMSPRDRGQALAALIPGTRLLLVEGMGHSLPRACWEELLGAILLHTSMPESPIPASQNS
jgi:pimeloyl-ACP methyl ester carboxylesterase